MVNISPEHKVLFQLLRGELKSLPEQLDHNRLFELFRRHKLFTISGQVKDLLPEEEKIRWKEIHQRNTMHSLKISSETAEIIKHLKELSIKAIPLKGPVLANTLYGDVGLRHFNDIDLVVDKADLDKAKEALVKTGYTQMYPEKMSKKQEKLYTTYKKDIGLHNPERRVFIELHYGIYVHELLKKKEESKLLGSTEVINLHKQEIEVLNKEANFIYLVYHGCLHQYFRLFWLRDVAECIKKWDLDHKQIRQRINELGLEKMLGVSVNLLLHYFNTDIPNAYKDLLAENRDQKLLNLCHERICGPEAETTKLKIGRHRFLMSLKPGVKFKWTVIWSIFQRWRIRKYLGGH